MINKTLYTIGMFIGFLSMLFGDPNAKWTGLGLLLFCGFLLISSDIEENK